MPNPAPTTATGRMEAARRHRSRAYAERNELIGVLARLWDSHLMPVTGALGTLNKRSVVCIHSPAGLLCWVVTKEEAEEYFAPMTHIDENHWDKSTRVERSKRLAELTALPVPAAVRKRAARGAAKRRPGDFSRRRR
jgi:hypothetical protein